MRKLSIIILNFNTKDFLLQCLESIYENYTEEVKKGDYEVVVVDNASIDESFAFVKSQISKPKLQTIKFIENKKNLGFAAGNNRVLKKINSEYVLLLNPDTKVDGQAIAETLRFMEKNKGAVVATAKVVLPDGSLYYACHRGFPTPWNAFCYFSGLGGLFPKAALFNGYTLSNLNLDEIHEIDACSGSFMMIRSDLGKKLNWLDEDYFWYGEDLDFCYRVKQAGYKVYFVPKGKTVHYWGAASGLKKTTNRKVKVALETKLRSTKARFEVMKIFYKKHYQKTYPGIITGFVLAGIKIKYWFELIRLRLT